MVMPLPEAGRRETTLAKLNCRINVNELTAIQLQNVENLLTLKVIIPAFLSWLLPSARRLITAQQVAAAKKKNGAPTPTNVLRFSIVRLPARSNPGGARLF
jgi:hypothetical protein